MHRYSLVPAVVILMFLAVPSRADDADDAVFVKLWEEAKKDPEKADYKAIREAYIKTSKYQPYQRLTKEYQAVNKAKSAKDIPAAIESINAVLEKKPLDVDSQMQAAFLHGQGGDKKLEQMHQKLAIGLGQAIIEGHNGMSFEEAIPVIAIDEEYFVIKMLKFKSSGHSLQEHNGRRYDVHMIKIPGAAESKEIYFDVTTPMNEISKMLKPKK